jgi:hypothetical protein
MPLIRAATLPVIDVCVRDLSSLGAGTAEAELEALGRLAEAAGLEAGLVILDADRVGPLPGRLRGLAFFDARDPGPALAAVQRACAENAGSAIGVAAAFARQARDPRLLAFAPLYDYCTGTRLPLVVEAPADERQLLALGVLARAYPALTLLCRVEADCPPLLVDLLSRFPNLAVTLPLPPPAPLGRRGSRQVLFGSQGRPEYAAAMAALCALPRRHRAAVAADNARRLFGPRLAGRPS